MEKAITQSLSMTDSLVTISKSASKSGLYKMSQDHIFMVLLAAHELDIMPMQALNGGIWIIQGRVEVSARMMNLMIRKHGHSVVVKKCTNEVCILEGIRRDSGDTAVCQFTIEEAKKIGLASRDVWIKYTEDMLFARALSRLARRLFPDVIGNAYVEGEIDESKLEVVDAVISDMAGTEATEDIDQINKKYAILFKDISYSDWALCRSKILSQANDRGIPELEAIDKYMENKDLLMENLKIWKAKADKST